jgi:molybdopterin synthase catalytic subunit
MQMCLTEGPVRISDISSMIAKMGKIFDVGGHSLFIGQARADVIDNKTVIAIEYTAYEQMVKAESEKIKATVISEYPDVRSVEIIHSVGLVKAGEISLVIMISAGHRQQAMEACSRTVEMVKERFPVWKKEIFDDSSFQWKQDN